MTVVKHKILVVCADLYLFWFCLGPAPPPPEKKNALKRDRVAKCLMSSLDETSRWRLFVLPLSTTMYPKLNSTNTHTHTHTHTQLNILKVLNHPNVVKLHQYFPHETGYYFVVLEYVAGGELLDLVVKKVGRVYASKI